MKVAVKPGDATDSSEVEVKLNFQCSEMADVQALVAATRCDSGYVDIEFSEHTDFG